MGSEEDRSDRGPGGGAANEAGSALRSGVAAYIAAHILRGQPFHHLGLLPELAVPLSMRQEARMPVDDLVVALTGGGTAFLQAKRSLGSASLDAVVSQ